MGGKKNKRKNSEMQADIPKETVQSNPQLPNEEFYRKMAESFANRLDNMNFSQNSTRTESVQIDSVQQKASELIQKELELKNREIELLKRENAILKLEAASTSTSGEQKQAAFLFKDLEESLNMFSGDDSYSVDKFLADIEEAALCAGWNVLQKTIYAKRLLIGTAKNSLRITTNIDTFEKLSEHLRKEFNTSINSAKIHKMLENRKKQPEESYKSYLIVLREIALGGGVDDASILRYCIDGISDSAYNKSILYGAKDMDDFKSKLELYEEIKHKANTENKTISFPHKKFNGNRRNHRSEKKCYGCGEADHEQKSCPHKDKGPKCFRCNEFGHVAPKCTNTDKQRNLMLIQGQPEKRSDQVEIGIGGIKCWALVDNGSDLNLIKHSYYWSLNLPLYEKVITEFSGAGSKGLKTEGRLFTDVEVNGEIYQIFLHIVADDIIPVNLLVGKELIRQTVLLITPENIFMTKYHPSLFENYCLAVDKINPTEINLENLNDQCTADEILKMAQSYQPKKFNEVRDDSINVKMNIILEDEKPIYQRPRRLSPSETEFVRKQINDWLEEGIIRPSSSAFGSPVVLANKKNGEKRLCIDYRKLNKVIIKDRYPLPLIEDQIDRLHGMKWFSTIDLRNGFFHVPVASDSIQYTAFVTPFGQYEFLRVPFGLCNSPSVFQRYINRIFQPLILSKVICVYMDDVIISAINQKEALEKLHSVLKVCEKHGLQINWKKCRFLVNTVEYLGYIISENCIRTSDAKKKAISKFPEPLNIKQLQRFLGLTGYFRKFVERYAIIARPLTELTRKNTSYNFGDAERRAYEKLKEILVSDVVLRIYAPSAVTELHTDASKFGLGAVLLQKSNDDLQLHPVYYYSRKTLLREQNYTSYELEVLAIVAALKKLRVYLLGIPFRIVTDCAAFKGTMEKKELAARIAGWALLLQEYDYILEHRSSNRMKHVDALSRAPALLTINSSVITRVMAAQKSDEHLMLILKILETGTYKDYISNNGCLFKMVNGKMVLVVPKSMQQEVVRSLHEMGHFGQKKTEELTSREFYIPKLSESIKSCIKNCIPCILAERKKGKRDGFLNPIPKGDEPLSTYHVDHLGSLHPTAKQYKYILLVIDGFTKFVWLYPTKTKSSTEAIHKLDVQKAIFGNPARIVSDQGTSFTSAEFKDYCKRENIDHWVITAGVPTGNGQVERINRIIIPALTKVSMEHPTLWYKHVADLQRYLNNSFQRGIQMTPFELLMGVKMKSSENPPLVEIIEQELAETFCANRDELRQKAGDAIAKIQEENRKSYNLKRRSAPTYKVGEMVAIRRTQFESSKLQQKYLGPYEVAKVKANNRYEVRKVGDNEGPKLTSTSAEFMKLWYENLSDHSEISEDEEEVNITNMVHPSRMDIQDGRVG